jgi:hypothetical protein
MKLNTYALYFRRITQLSGYGRYLSCLGGVFRKSNIAVGASYHAERGRGQRLRLKYGAQNRRFGFGWFGFGFNNRPARDLHSNHLTRSSPYFSAPVAFQHPGKQLYLTRSRRKDVLNAAPRSCSRVYYSRPRISELPLVRFLYDLFALYLLHWPKGDVYVQSLEDTFFSRLTAWNYTDDENIDDTTEMQFPCVALDLPSRIIFVHSYMYCNLLKHKLMSIVDRPSDRPQLERHCCSQ